MTDSIRSTISQTQAAVRAIRSSRQALESDIAIKLKDFTQTTGIRVSSVTVSQWDAFGGTLDYTVDIEVAL
jgi:hypothetical protein